MNSSLDKNWIAVDARTMSGIEFMGSLGFSSPARRAKRAAEGRKIEAAHRAKLRADILQMRENIAELLSPDNAAKAREEWALQDQVAEELAFTIEQQRRVA